MIGSEIGVENYHPEGEIHGIIANPPCTEFSIARDGGKPRDPEAGFALVWECLRIINEAKPKWYAIENPATGALKKYLGTPRHTYEPWEYGSPWTKRTALWGNFNIPPKIYTRWEDVPKNPDLPIYQNRSKPSLAKLHHPHKRFIREFDPFTATNDMEFRSLCSQNFALAFLKSNP